MFAALEVPQLDQVLPLVGSPDPTGFRFRKAAGRGTGFAGSERSLIGTE
jgi:hypothetical protein